MAWTEDCESSVRGLTPSEQDERLRRTEVYIELHGLDEGIIRQIASLVTRLFAERARRTRT